MSSNEETVKQFWQEIIYKDGKLDEEQVLKELSDYYHVLQEVPMVYMHITGGKLSKTNYYARDVIALADDETQRTVEDEIAEAITATKQEMVEDLKRFWDKKDPYWYATDLISKYSNELQDRKVEE